MLTPRGEKCLALLARLHLDELRPVRGPLVSAIGAGA